MLRLMMCMFFTTQCGAELVTTDELSLAMAGALAKGWQHVQMPPENAR
jgi:hypothetical protein